MCTHLHWASARNKGPVKVLRQAQLLFNEQVPAGNHIIISLVGRADTYRWGPHKANCINCIIRVICGKDPASTPLPLLQYSSSPLWVVTHSVHSISSLLQSLQEILHPLKVPVVVHLAAVSPCSQLEAQQQACRVMTCRVAVAASAVHCHWPAVPLSINQTTKRSTR